MLSLEYFFTGAFEGCVINTQTVFLRRERLLSVLINLLTVLQRLNLVDLRS